MLTSLLEEKEIINLDLLEAYFIQALTWSLGAALQEDGRIKFDQYMKYLSALPTVEHVNGVAGAGK